MDEPSPAVQAGGMKIAGDRLEEITAGVGLDPRAVEEAELLRAELLGRADEARRTVKAMFGFVMRHEKTTEPLACTLTPWFPTGSSLD